MPWTEEIHSHTRSRDAWSVDSKHLLQQLAELGRALQGLPQRSEIQFIDDQRHALKTPRMVVDAEADLVRALRLAFRELQQLDRRDVVLRLDLDFLLDDPAAPMERESLHGPPPRSSRIARHAPSTSSPETVRT
jgi:hypothetical protein